VQRNAWLCLSLRRSRNKPANWNFLTWSCAVLASLAAIGTSPIPSSAQSNTFRTPPVKIPLNVKDQSITITAWALMSVASTNHDVDILTLKLTADLAALQENITPLLSSQLDKDDHCGERIAIQQATLVPADPASVTTVQLHYERWACAKNLGKQQAKRLIGGNALIPVKLTPGIEKDNTELRLIPEVGTIQADGSLGELLRSGALGDMIREKIRSAILSALQKGTNLSATLPPVVQGYVTLQNAEFKDEGAGRLAAVLDGEIHITREQLQILSKQVKERIAAQ
jgi:hypothetical protein